MTSSFVCATLNLGRKKSTGTEPTPHCITTRETSCINHESYFFLLIQKNIVVDEIGRIVCSHPLARAQTFFI